MRRVHAQIIQTPTFQTGLLRNSRRQTVRIFWGIADESPELPVLYLYLFHRQAIRLLFLPLLVKSPNALAEWRGFHQSGFCLFVLLHHAETDFPSLSE